MQVTSDAGINTTDRLTHIRDRAIFRPVELILIVHVNHWNFISYVVCVCYCVQQMCLFASL